MQIVLKTANDEPVENIYNDEIWMMAQTSNVIFLPDKNGTITGFFISSKSFLPNNILKIGLIKTHEFLDI